MIEIPIAALAEAAKARPPGYLEAVCARGDIVGDRLRLTDSAYADLLLKYRSDTAAPLPPGYHHPGCPGCGT